MTHRLPLRPSLPHSLRAASLWCFPPKTQRLQNRCVGQRKAAAPEILAAEQRLVEGVQGGQVLYVGDALVHGPGEVVPVVEAAQDDAGDVDRLHKDAEQGALDAHHVPPEGRGTGP